MNFLQKKVYERIGIALILILSCHIAKADLLLLQDTDLATVYYEPPIISGSKGIIPVWTLNNLKVNNTDGKTLKTFNEINCNTAEYRILYAIRLSGEMGRGTLVRESKRVDEWRKISPGTPAELLHSKVCY
jgi:hypothetical protein